jgi:hypothetical protein
MFERDVFMDLAEVFYGIASCVALLYDKYYGSKKLLTHSKSAECFLYIMQVVQHK